MNILFISPYHSGSHQAWAEGYQRYSQHKIHLLTLPGQLWKWRMHGAAVTLARQFLASSLQPDLILADDMLDLATFLALTRKRTAHIPAVLYMHENQLTYPLPADKTKGPMRRNMGLRERQYVLINWKAMLTADHILFNSGYHLQSWFEALPNFLKHYTQHNELETVDLLQKKSSVLPVGIDLKRLAVDVTPPPPPNQDQPPLIIWNQRWEFDKNPKMFFDALYALQAEKRPFRLALCGENFQQKPELFLEAQKRLRNELIHCGYANSSTYKLLLQQAEITISTARHEFFGISVLEAVSTTTFPILPRRLSYPEIIPEPYQTHCLYKNFTDLVKKLHWVLDHRKLAHQQAAGLATAVMRYDWSQQAPLYDVQMLKLSQQ